MQKKKPKLCDTFKGISIWTWIRMRWSRDLSYQLKEETVTDMIILELKRKHPKEIIVHAFNRVEEGENGADWEWWFVNSGKWIGVRVQAKILNIKSNAFEMLAYKNQCDKLISNSVKVIPPRVPLYALYLQTPNNKSPRAWTCTTFKEDRNLWGCSTISALQVKKLKNLKKKKLADVSPYLAPLHCLVCCNSRNNSLDVIALNTYLKDILVTSGEDTDFKDDIPESFIVDSPPNYVAKLYSDPNNEIERSDENLEGFIIINLDQLNAIEFYKRE